jgi:Fur family ferric uptake transcriptional regulator
VISYDTRVRFARNDSTDGEDDAVSKANDTQSDIAAAQAEIRSAGLRATPARVATLLVLRRSDAPRTHAEVAEQLCTGGIDKATAFRNLNDLAEVGLLRRSELGDHVWRFEAIGPSESTEQGHPHFVCVDCGTVTCMDQVRLTAGSLRYSEHVGEVTEILLRGHCNDCR